MAIGSIGSGSGGTYSSQSSITSKATQFFGNGSAGSATSLFSTAAAASSGLTVNTTQLVTKGLQDQIDRLQGYRTNLSVAEKQKLADYQTKITGLNQLASTRLLTTGEKSDRAEAYVKSYKILGKEYIDYSSDSYVTKRANAITELLATKPQGAEANRLEQLQSAYDTLTTQADNVDGAIPTFLGSQILSIARQIAEITTPRKIASLTIEERKQHDTLVGEINDYAGFEYELTSDKKIKIEKLQAMIRAVNSGQTGALYI